MKIILNCVKELITKDQIIVTTMIGLSLIIGMVVILITSYLI
jgi:hypothetical protein